MKYTPRVQRMIESFDVPVKYVPELWAKRDKQVDGGSHRTDDFMGAAEISHTDFTSESVALVILAHEYGHHLVYCDMNEFYDTFVYQQQYLNEKLAWRRGFKFARTHGLLTLDDIKDCLPFIRFCLNTYRPTLQGGF